MNGIEPEYSEGVVIQNNVTDEQFTVVNISYDKQLAEIVYACQNRRFKFNMFKVPEAVITRNTERGRYKVIK